MHGAMIFARLRLLESRIADLSPSALERTGGGAPHAPLQPADPASDSGSRAAQEPQRTPPEPSASGSSRQAERKRAAANNPLLNPARRRSSAHGDADGTSMPPELPGQAGTTPERRGDPGSATTETPPSRATPGSRASARLTPPPLPPLNDLESTPSSAGAPDADLAEPSSPPSTLVAAGSTASRGQPHRSRPDDPASSSSSAAPFAATPSDTEATASPASPSSAVSRAPADQSPRHGRGQGAALSPTGRSEPDATSNAGGDARAEAPASTSLLLPQGDQAAAAPTAPSTPRGEASAPAAAPDRPPSAAPQPAHPSADGLSPARRAPPAADTSTLLDPRLVEPDPPAEPQRQGGPLAAAGIEATSPREARSVAGPHSVSGEAEDCDLDANELSLAQDWQPPRRAPPPAPGAKATPPQAAEAVPAAASAAPAQAGAAAGASARLDTPSRARAFLSAKPGSAVPHTVADAVATRLEHPDTAGAEELGGADAEDADGSDRHSRASVRSARSGRLSVPRATTPPRS